MDLQTPTERHNTFLSFPLPIPIPIIIKKNIYAFSFLLLIVTIIVFSNVLNPFDSESESESESFIGFQAISPSQQEEDQQKNATLCDYSNGEWVWDETYPSKILKYNESCQFLDPGFQCHLNGRGNQSFRHWRWQPYGCDVPRFNASDFLERCRNGRIVFAGDSIGRNQWQSLLCMLAQGVSNQSSIYETKGVPLTRHKGYFSVMFQEYNLTVEYYRVPFLVRVVRPPPKSPGQVRGAIKVDKLHWYSQKWVGADLYVFNGGHWWNEDKTIGAGIYFQEGESVNVTMHFMEAFRRSLRTWKIWAERKLDQQRSHIYFRSFASVHFRNGTWSTGGTCRNSNAPEMNKTKLHEDPLFNQYISDVLKEMKAAKMKVNLLNITYLSDFRTDGHPSIHREPGTPQSNIEDCSHWCLPGVPDTWNELLYSQLLAEDFRTR